MKGLIDYFQEEMQLLNEAIYDFKEFHPDVAKLLNLDSVKERDPHIERLLEGCAYLSSRIKQQIDYGVTHLNESIIRSLAPKYLKALPSWCIIEFKNFKRLPNTLTIPANTTLTSDLVGSEETKCSFKTLEPLTILPLNLKNLSLTTNKLSLHLEFFEEVNLKNLKFNYIDFYINAPEPLALQWLYILTHKIHSVRFYTDKKLFYVAEQNSMNKASKAISKFLRNDLDRFFLCRDNEFFWRLQCQDIKWKENNFRIEIEFAFNENLRIMPELFKLNCLPAVNIFEYSGEPFRADACHEDYRITLNKGKGKSYYFYDLKSVTATYKNSQSIEVLSNLSNVDRRQTDKIYYRLRQKFIDNHYAEHFLSFDKLTSDAIISFKALACNGFYPQYHLTSQALNLAKKLDDFTATNITRPSKFSPANYTEMELVLLTVNLHKTIEDFLNVDEFKNHLRLHDKHKLHNEYIDNITSLEGAKNLKVVQGVLKNCFDIVIFMGDKKSAEELYLFGEIIFLFFKSLLPFSAELSLKILNNRNAELLTWNSDE